MTGTHLCGIQLTSEQNEILDTCKPPPTEGIGHLVRVTAAAGTGKTTTLLCLALRAAELGHQNITYLTFTKAAALDGMKRLSKALEESTLAGKVAIDARTLHSCAFRALEQHQRDHQKPHTSNGLSGGRGKVWSDKKLRKWIAETLDFEIDSFLGPCYHEIHRRKHASENAESTARRLARDKVEFFLYKTLTQFCTRAMSRTEFGKRETFGRTYYPAELFHKSDKKGPKFGFSMNAYNAATLNWYADHACKLWDKIVEEDIRTFNFIMKRAQLLSLEVSGTILLIDESQDMDGCQVSWVADQVKFAKHAYVVGDAAQSIYSFRGAKPEFLMDLMIDEERMLTESWRFGPGIAKIANLVLFAKENSDQTVKVYCRRRHCEKWKNWSPYRVKAGKEMPSIVTERSLLTEWRNYRERKEKITFIARTNKTLLVEALKVIGFDPATDKIDESNAKHTKNAAMKSNRTYGISEKDEETASDSEDYNSECVDEDIVNERPRHKQVNSRLARNENNLLYETAHALPKIHINGFGENSGRKAWLSIFKLIGAVYELFELHEDNQDESAAATTKLAPNLFPEFADKFVSWPMFCEDVQDREMYRYMVPISVVTTYQEYTMEAVDLFRKQVVDRNYPSEEADLIFTTCHAAKGMEWVHVQLADDFIPLANYEVRPVQYSGFVSASGKKLKVSREWKFGFQPWGDDLNLAYVACTRAKLTLALPLCILNSIADFDTIMYWNLSKEKPEELPDVHGLNKEQYTTESLEEIHHCLVLKLREELGISGTASLHDHLLTAENT